MFTGIVKETGVVRRFVKSGPAYRLEAQSSEIYKDAGIGDSVSVNGVCLTLIQKSGNALNFDVMEETVRRSALSSLKKGDKVNLEDSLKAGGSIGGHFVLGHIDCVGRIANIKNVAGECAIEVGFPDRFANMVVVKGSIALDGISLTVGAAGKDTFIVYVIPHTLKVTNLGSKNAGDNVNIEFDIIGKYIARFDDLKTGGRISEDYLRKKGFI